MKNTCVFSIIATLLFSTACSDGADPKESTATLSPELAKGEKVVAGTCIKCHGQGINGAPILGNKKMWAKRLIQGEDILVEHATNGFAMGMMPPKGGNPDLTDEDIRYAVRYMTSLVQPGNIE